MVIENKQNFPLACKIIEHDFYVDDLITGANSIENARKIVKEVSAILSSGCFPLRKWRSNEPNIFNDLGIENEELGLLKIGDNDCEAKTLGILWDLQLDMFQYSLKGFNKSRVTKRVILATTAQIFDPLGLLGPIIVTAKIIIQALWQLKLSWDESVPLDINSKWQELCDQLEALNDLKIPRHILLYESVYTELHGFADASEAAYGACVYVRCIDKFKNCSVNLLCARSRVAPLKRVTLPRCSPTS